MPNLDYIFALFMLFFFLSTLIARARNEEVFIKHFVLQGTYLTCCAIFSLQDFANAQNTLILRLIFIMGLTQGFPLAIWHGDLYAGSKTTLATVVLISYVIFAYSILNSFLINYSNLELPFFISFAILSVNVVFIILAQYSELSKAKNLAYIHGYFLALLLPFFTYYKSNFLDAKIVIIQVILYSTFSLLTVVKVHEHFVAGLFFVTLSGFLLGSLQIGYFFATLVWFSALLFILALNNARKLQKTL